MGNGGGNGFKNNVDSVDIELDFEIDSKKGQDELSKFGYYFNKKGQCRSIKNDERVGRFPSQKEYEEFGAALERYIFFLLRDQYKMTEIQLNSQNDKNDDKKAPKPSKPSKPSKNYDNDNQQCDENENENNENDKNDKKEQKKEESNNDDDNSNDNDNKNDKRKKRKNFGELDSSKIAKSRIYLSPSYGEKETLLLLIPGSGAVRAGQWARSICINDNLAAGCMYPFIAAAYQRNWGVVLFDPNGRTNEGRIFSDEHVLYVYENYVEKPYLSQKNCAIKNVLIVCHSAGGMATTRLLNNKTKYLTPRIRGVAGTDTFFGRAKNNMIEEIYKKYIVNWVTSSQPLGTILSNTVPKRVSAGHNAHEYTSAAAFKQIFNYFDAMMKLHNNQSVKIGNNDGGGGKKKKEKVDKEEKPKEKEKENVDKNDNDNDKQNDGDTGMEIDD